MEDPIKISKANALQALKQADPITKKVLSVLLGIDGKELTGNIIDWIKSFEDACEDQGLDPADVLPYKNPKNEEEFALNAVKKLWVIGKSLRGDWQADYDNKQQKKFWPWFTKGASGFGFSSTNAYYDCTSATVGARLVFPTYELAEYFGKQFIDLHNLVLIQSNK